jgi:DUF4097 and DUF4098 domain-containing protein YvlB
MKRIAIPLLAGMVFCCTQAPAQKLESKEHISKEFTTKNPSGSVVTIYNINGSIKIEGYSGDKVLMEIDKTISAKESQILEEGKQEFKFEIEQKGDSIIAYIVAPFDSRPKKNNNNWDERKKILYQYHLDFTVKVPNSINLHVSTVNGGDVQVSDVTGSLGVYNVNGAIKVSNAKRVTEMRTVNGNVDANFVTVPSGASSFKTINGNINLVYPASLSADCEYKSFNGAFYTDFPEAIALPPTVTKTELKDDNKTVYKLNKSSAIRIGNEGNNKLKLETFNGNIYIKKQS